MKHLLITRFSAMGDVAMCVPVVWSLAKKYKDLKITFLSRKNFQSMFLNMPENVEFLGIDLKKDYKGIRGLNMLFNQIKALNIDIYADFHNVLRTKYLRFRAFFSNIKCAKINKGRGDKKQLSKLGANKFGKDLKPTINRYVDVLKKLGFEVELTFSSIFGNQKPQLPKSIFSICGPKICQWVGIAPFAAHEGKIYPLHLMQKVVKMLTDKGCHVFLFGAGNYEKNILEGWQARFQSAVSVVGKLGGLENELILISYLDAMICMDSANMHLASLVGTRAISIWGATHPAAGFLGYKQMIEDVVQTNLDCRPCSIYGNKECKITEKYQCLNSISPETIVNKVFNYQ